MEMSQKIGARSIVVMLIMAISKWADKHEHFNTLVCYRYYGPYRWEVEVSLSYGRLDAVAVFSVPDYNYCKDVEKHGEFIMTAINDLDALSREFPAKG